MICPSYNTPMWSTPTQMKLESTISLGLSCFNGWLPPDLYFLKVSFSSSMSLSRVQSIQQLSCKILISRIQFLVVVWFMCCCLVDCTQSSKTIFWYFFFLLMGTRNLACLLGKRSLWSTSSHMSYSEFCLLSGSEHLLIEMLNAYIVKEHFQRPFLLSLSILKLRKLNSSFNYIFMLTLSLIKALLLKLRKIISQVRN